jgi:hypothetical protein
MILLFVSFVDQQDHQHSYKILQARFQIGIFNLYWYVTVVI